MCDEIKSENSINLPRNKIIYLSEARNSRITANVLYRWYRGRFLGGNLADRFNFMGVLFLVMSPLAAEPIMMILGVGTPANWGRLDYPEARADSPQIVRGQKLLPEIIRFACWLHQFQRAVLWYHEGAASPPQSQSQRCAAPMWRLFRSNEPSNLTRSGTWLDTDLMKNAS